MEKTGVLDMHAAIEDVKNAYILNQKQDVINPGKCVLRWGKTIEDENDHPHDKQIGQHTKNADTAKIIGNQGCRHNRCAQGYRNRRSGASPQPVHQLLFLVNMPLANLEQILPDSLRKQENTYHTAHRKLEADR